MSSKSERKQRKREKKRKRQEQKAAQKMQAANPPPPPPPSEPVEIPQQPDQPNCAEGSSSQQDRGQRPPSVRPWMSWLSNPSRRCLLIADLAIATSIAISTAAQVYYGNKQWDATEKQWQSMEKQLTLMQDDIRPWLDWETPKIETMAAGERLRSVADIVNTGRTPGTIIGHSGYSVLATPGNGLVPRHGQFVLELDMDKILKIIRARVQSMRADVQGIVSPERSTSIDFAEQKPMTAAEFAGINSKGGANDPLPVMMTSILYVKYLDSLGKEHETWRTFEYDPDTGEYRRIPQYNYMD